MRAGDDGDVDLDTMDDWPFGNEPRAVRGCLRALDQTRDKSVIDVGSGIRRYPASAMALPSHVFDSTSGKCTSDFCRSVPGRCVHAWEDDFRFGVHRGRGYMPLARIVRVHEDGHMDRHLPRPNSSVAGATAATRARWAREAMPMRSGQVLYEAIQVARAEEEREMEIDARRSGAPWPPPRLPGRPKVDAYDVAYADVMRFAEAFTYEAMKSKITRMHEDGFIKTDFLYKRLIDAAMSQRMPDVLERIAGVMLRPFRKIANTYAIDGVVWSSNHGDSARKKRLEADAAVVNCHSMYEIRWGLLVSMRLTWYARGTGSGEAPQLPYLVSCARRHLDVETVLADRAYSSERNFAYADSVPKFNLYSALKDGSFDLETKIFLSLERAREILTTRSASDPTMSQVLPFRQRVEGWHGVIRENTWRHLNSHPDRMTRPATKSRKDLKTNPNAAERELPEDQAERDAFIDRHQFVGRSTTNEFMLRRLLTIIRGTVKAEAWYDEQVSYNSGRAFVPRPEDDEWSVFRAIR